MSDDLSYEPQPAETLPETPAVPAGVPWFRRPLVVGGVGLIVGAAIVGGAWAASTPDNPGTFTLTGVLDLAGDHGPVPPDNKACQGMGGYNDIAEGAEVTVLDDAGKVVAVGALKAGQYQDSANYSGDCLFGVEVRGVPKGSKFYQVEVTHRGKLLSPAAEAEAGKFAATLGN